MVFRRRKRDDGAHSVSSIPQVILRKYFHVRTVIETPITPICRDYPPGFAFFEYALSNSPITTRLLRSGWLDEKCLALLPDSDNEPSDSCIKFQRITVIASDVVLFLGAYFATSAMKRLGEYRCGRSPLTTFFLVVSNPGLLLLDHIHFQYNGMMLGVLLMSIGCLVRGSERGSSTASQIWELSGAACYAFLLSMKHLYVILAPLYLVYLFRRHCFVTTGTDDEGIQLKFSISRLACLAFVTLASFLGPFVPFLIQNDPAGQILQIMARLFPFGRGLVHDYWAGNLWALYLFIGKIAAFVLRKLPLPLEVKSMLGPLIPFPLPSPRIVALCMLIGLIPVIRQAWMVGTWSHTRRQICSPGKFFIHGVVFSSLSGFMLGYHVHEKAIMTAIVPMTLVAADTRKNTRIFIRMSIFGVFGLLPLLYRPNELPLKTFMYISWIFGTVVALERVNVDQNAGYRTVMQFADKMCLLFLGMVFAFMEIIHPLVFGENLEFLLLMLTSVTCSAGLMWLWGEEIEELLHCSMKSA